MNLQTKLTLSLLVLISFISSCTTIPQSTSDHESRLLIEKSFGNGIVLEFHFEKGKHHNHPSFAVWIESLEGELIQTIYVTQSVATGYYAYGDPRDGSWLKVPDPAARPASLPYWLHRREIGVAGQLPDPDNPLPDAYTGATHTASFNMLAETKESLPDRFKVLAEVNQPWDWNGYWTNDKFENEAEYRTSAQPALIYAVEVDLNEP